MLSLSVIIILLNSCTKGGGGNNGGGGGGGNGGGGNSGSITITSITPTNPYPDDAITITGTGFNTDAGKDTVEFGRLINGNFGAWHEGLDSEWPSLCTVVSATATQLVVKAVNPFKLDFSAFPVGTTSIAALQVRTGGKKAVSPLIPLKRYFLLTSIANPELFNDAIGRPGDSLVIIGKGFRSSGMSASIDGTLLTNFKIDSTSGLSNLTLRLPKTFFGGENDESIMLDKTVAISNPDGKTSTHSFKFLVSPQMRVSGMQPEFPSYSRNGLGGSGGVIKIFVSGRSLKSDAIVKIGAVGYTGESGLGVTGFPDSKTIEISAGSTMPLGTYTVGIWRGNTFYGSCHFTLTQ